MRKITNTQYKTVIALTSATLQQYTQFCLQYAQDDDKCDSVMHLGDILHMQRALNKFIHTANADALQDSIMQQDTFVREYYIDTLRYIEDCNLTINKYCVV